MGAPFVHQSTNPLYTILYKPDHVAHPLARTINRRYFTPQNVHLKPTSCPCLIWNNEKNMGVIRQVIRQTVPHSSKGGLFFCSFLQCSFGSEAAIGKNVHKNGWILRCGPFWHIGFSILSMKAISGPHPPIP